MAKQTFIITEDLHIQDPHDVFLSLFESSNDEMILWGTLKEFLKRAVILVLALAGMRALFENHLPGIIEIIAAIVVAIASVFFVHFTVKNFIPFLLSSRTRKAAKLAAVTSLFIVVGALIGLG
jgi:hypothetical protein